MKMISSTSTTSTSGVTLISASELCVRPCAIGERHSPVPRHELR